MSKQDKLIMLKLALREARKQEELCHKAIGIINKLKPSKYKSQHSSRVFSRLNRTRALIKDIETAWLPLI